MQGSSHPPSSPRLQSSCLPSFLTLPLLLLMRHVLALILPLADSLLLRLSTLLSLLLLLFLLNQPPSFLLLFPLPDRLLCDLRHVGIGWLENFSKSNCILNQLLLNTAPYSIPDAGQKTKWRTAGNIYTYKQRVTQIHTQRENYTIEIDRPGAKKYEMKNTVYSDRPTKTDTQTQTHRRVEAELDKKTEVSCCHAFCQSLDSNWRKYLM